MLGTATDSRVLYWSRQACFLIKLKLDLLMTVMECIPIHAKGDQTRCHPNNGLMVCEWRLTLLYILYFFLFFLWRHVVSLFVYIPHLLLINWFPGAHVVVAWTMAELRSGVAWRKVYHQSLCWITYIHQLRHN